MIVVILGVGGGGEFARTLLDPAATTVQAQSQRGKLERMKNL